MELPSLPTTFPSVIALLNTASSQSAVFDAVQPYIEYENKLRQIFAQQPTHDAVKIDHLVPMFGNDELLVRARNPDLQSDAEKEKYLLPLTDAKRRKDGSPALINNLKDFKTNFNIFSEQSLAEIDWSNVVVAGSSALTPLLPIHKPHNESKRALRTYYHEKLAPASDVDIFIYGLNEEQAIEKIKSIERSVRDSILAECTTIRTKNAITIVSEYPTRHIQIILRLYNSITEILTGFDVDCSCVAYDGQQVWASPRALAAFATQQNRIDLTRRSPSYENRLSKYAHRGFEVFWPAIDRTRIDPTIFERAFKRVVGLARLLVLEKLPHPTDRDAYSDKRRKERGRPDLPWNARYRHTLPGNVKDAQPDDVPDWLEDTAHSDYHTFTIPYGPKYNAKRIEKLLFKQDLLLNAEWNRPKDRLTALHRHPAFFGSVNDVIQDCCGYCPDPITDEDLKAHEDESKLYISGELHFMKDNPGRQAIGSFNPLNDNDWTDMAYVGSTTTLCQAIVDNDVDAVKDWFNGEGVDVNHRDHTGRTPLQLACMCSSPEIVNVLIEHGARVVSRIYNGMTALHMASHRGQVDIVKLLLDKSEANREEEDRKEGAKTEARRNAASKPQDVEMTQDGDEDIDMIGSDDEESEADDAMTEGSFVKVKEEQAEDDNEDEPDVYDIDVLAWDSPVSPLHLAIMAGHTHVIKVLVGTYSADAMLPVQIKEGSDIMRTLLNLVLPLQLSASKAIDTIRVLLSNGASLAQADSHKKSNLHHLVAGAKTQVIEFLSDLDGGIVRNLVNHIIMNGWQSSPSLDSPLFTAIKSGNPEMVRKLLGLGAKPVIEYEAFARAYTQKFESTDQDHDALKDLYRKSVEQPFIEMVKWHQLVDVVSEVVDTGIDVNFLTRGAHTLLSTGVETYGLGIHSLLDLVRDKIAELTDYKGEKDESPWKPDDLPAYVGPQIDSYQSWLLRKNHEQAQSLHTEQIEKYETDVKEHVKRGNPGHAEKENTIRELLEKWLALEAKLCEKGAKTFEELQPDVDKGDNVYKPMWGTPGRSGFNRDKAWENRISFQVPGLTDSKHEDYIKLFNAVYAEDEKTVKELCISAENPIQVAVSDSAGFTPFSLAVSRKYYDIARTVLDIAAAQYQPATKDEKKYRYSIRRADEEYDSDYASDSEDNSEDRDVKVYKQLVDEKNTIDDIRLLSDHIKSRTSPVALFETLPQPWRILSTSEAAAKSAFQPLQPNREFNPYYDDQKTAWGWFNEMLHREKDRNSFSLFRFAIVSNDLSMLKFLLGLRHDLYYRKDERNSLSKLQIDISDFNTALRLGRIDMISEIIRQTGMMLPLKHLAEKSGIEIDEKPEYYQGLSVYGQKRQDWAQQDRGSTATAQLDHGSPFLAAVMSGNIQTVEYFLSETPLRCYEEFTKNFEQDKNIQALTKAEGGIERALHNWMDARSNLAIHMAVMAQPATSKRVRDFLMKRMSQYVNIKSSDGLSPLQAAFALRNYEAAQDLINAGADQNTRNKEMHNLLHTIYLNRDKKKDQGMLQKFTSLLNPDIVQSLTVQRCSGDGETARTPLMSFLDGESELDDATRNDIDFMLEMSKEKDLEVMDGAGDYPLHSLMKSGEHKIDIAKHIATRRPDLLYRENATGMTPLEMIENTLFRSLFRSSSPWGSRSNEQIKPDITEINAEDFVGPSALKFKGAYHCPVRECFDAMSEIATQHPSSRQLISLLDANETARRLAEQQRKSNHWQQRRENALYGDKVDEAPDEKVVPDEVNQWMWKAQLLKAMDPIVDVSDSMKQHGRLSKRKLSGLKAN